MFIAFCFMIFSLVIAENKGKNLTDDIYWITTVICVIKFSNENEFTKIYDEIVKRKKLIIILSWIWNILTIVSFAMSNCYIKDAWGVKSYYGFGYAPHSLCASLCLMLTFIVVLNYKEKSTSWKTLVALVPGSIAILLSGSRSFLFALFVLWIICYRNCIKSKAIRIFLIPLVILGITFFIMRSSMAEKISFQIVFSNSSRNVQGKNLLDVITSGRLSIWKIDLEAFKECNIFRKLFGNGFDYVYRINELRYGMNIWAHNDLVDLLGSVGLLGTFFYIYLLVIQIFQFRLL